jgi:proteic killer suppression protein
VDAVEPIGSTPLSGPNITLDVINGLRYVCSMIKNFADRDTERLFRGQTSRRLPGEIQRIALRKLVQLNAAVDLEFLRVPPGNRLESLKGDRQGQHSIRINDRWRICFTWRDGDAHDVEIVDYH